MNELFFILLTLSFMSGWLFSNFISSLIVRLEVNKKISEESHYFKMIGEIAVGSGKFYSRVGNNVEIHFSMDNVNHILFYSIDRGDIGIFIGKECIRTTTKYTDKTVVSEIIKEIEDKWGKMINNVVVMNGIPVDKNTYNRIVSNFETGHIEEFPNKPKMNLDLDSILDKIGLVGYDGLTKLEKDFLNNIK